MKEKTAKQRANEKYRQNNKEYFNNYYKEYWKTHKRKNYNKIYKKRLDSIMEYIIGNRENAEIEFIERIARGEYDEE